MSWTELIGPDGAISIEIKAIADGHGVPCEIGKGVLHFVSTDWE